MVNLKKVLAVVLSTTMVVGASFTVFAAENEGSQTGAGSSEGHVDREIVDVILPTTTATTFAYTMDPERLISATEAAKYGEDVVFPEADDDTAVYFLAGEKTYANTSSKVQVVNKGAVAQALTVTAKLTAGSAKDIAILEEAPTGDEEDASLYLAAKVAGVEQALSTTGATWLINLTGNDSNYEIAYANNKYVYQKKTSGLSAWKAVDILVTGAVTEDIAIAEDTTAPTVTLTWSFDDFDSEYQPEWTEGTSLSDVSADAAPSIATTTYTLTADTALNINVSLGGGALAATKITALKNGGTALPADAWSYANGVLTITAARVNSIVNAGVSRTYAVVFDDEAKTTINITLDGTGN